MAQSEKLPYPPGPDPDDVPDDLTDYPPSYLNRERLLLLCQFVFLVIYFTFVLAAGFATAYLLYLVVSGAGLFSVLAVLGALVTGCVFAFLVLGLFRREDVDEELMIEVTEDDHPTLFAFVRRLCEDTGAEHPRKVLLCHHVYAAMYPRVTLANLFVPPQKDLIVGLGLVNCLNLSEFKAVFAHELGHFTQGTATGAYGLAVRRVVLNLVKGSDWFDRWVKQLRSSGGAGANLATVLGAPPATLNWVLMKVYVALFWMNYDLRREEEFHADLVAAALAGSDAATHALLRSEFGNESFGLALGELKKAADHKLYTSDLYFHQHAAGEILRKQKKDPLFGVPPRLDDRLAGKKVQVFDPDADYEHQTGEGHPSDYEREENVKARFVPAAIDERSPWLLFDDPAGLREKMTYKFYRANKLVPKGSALADPRKVQKFIDDEHQETTYDPRYDGAYDERMIAPGDLDELNDLIRREPWTDDRLTAVFHKLYHDVKGRAEDRNELQEEHDKILRQSGGGSSRKAKRLLKELEEKLDKANEWFDSLDRRAYLVFVQMAYRVHNDYYYDLVNRYRFHMAVQGMYKSARYHALRATFYCNTVLGDETQLHPDDFVEVMHVLRDARSALKKILREARELDMPAMKNFEEGDRLADFLLDQDVVAELPETYIKGRWIEKLLRQLDQVMSKAARLHFKSLGGILKLQEEIAAKFLVKDHPLRAEVIELKPT